MTNLKKLTQTYISPFKQHQYPDLILYDLGGTHKCVTLLLRSTRLHTV